MAKQTLPRQGSPPPQSEGHNQKWPTSGQDGYVTPAASGIPTTSEWGAKSEVAHKWAEWLHNPCRLRDPHRASKRGAKSEVAHKWSEWLHNPCRLGDPHRLRAGGKIRSGPQVCKMATQPLPPWAYPRLKSGGQNPKGPTSGQSGYITPGPWGIATASERGAKSEVAHKWARWLHNACRLGDPLRLRAFGAGGTIRIGPQVVKVATSTQPPRGSPPPRNGGQNQKWPTCGQGDYITTAALAIPTASERGPKLEVAHLWATWLHNL